MHCSGCKNLIALSLEESNFQEISVDLQKGTASFSAHKNLIEVEDILRDVFKGLKDYKYSELKEI